MDNLNKTLQSDNKIANPRFDFLNQLDIDQDVERRLSYLLSQTSAGSEEVFISPICREVTPEFILSEWDKVFLTNNSKMNDVLIKLENEQRDKFGPRSIALPWSERREVLLGSYLPDKIDNLNMKRPSNKLGRVLRPISLHKATKLLKNNTNSGLPYFTKKGTVKERVYEKFDKLLQRRDPCILFTRTQEQKKTRNVWGYPIADTLNEMMYYSPLLEYQRKLSYRSAIVSPDEIRGKITSIFRFANENGLKLISVDFSAYDNTVKSTLQKVAFNYIKELFQSRCDSDIEYIADRFNNIEIVTPEGIFKGPHGVPSGSTFTNEVDSIVQATIALSLPYIGELTFQVQGDDGVYAIPEDKYSEFVKYFSDLGLVLNEDKSYFSQDYCVYLQNLFHKDYVKDNLISGIYPIYRALNKIIFQERWANFEDFGISGKDYYSIRTICIVENCKYHPLFREFVAFMLKHDKYSLGLTDQGIAKYVQMFSNSQGTEGILKNQYGDDVGGIKSFETYKLIKELSG